MLVCNYTRKFGYSLFGLHADSHRIVRLREIIMLLEEGCTISKLTITTGQVVIPKLSYLQLNCKGSWGSESLGREEYMVSSTCNL